MDAPKCDRLVHSGYRYIRALLSVGGYNKFNKYASLTIMAMTPGFQIYIHCRCLANHRCLGSAHGWVRTFMAFPESAVASRRGRPLGTEARSQFKV